METSIQCKEFYVDSDLPAEDSVLDALNERVSDLLIVDRFVNAEPLDFGYFEGKLWAATKVLGDDWDLAEYLRILAQISTEFPENAFRVTFSPLEIEATLKNGVYQCEDISIDAFLAEHTVSSRPCLEGVYEKLTVRVVGAASEVESYRAEVLSRVLFASSTAADGALELVAELDGNVREIVFLLSELNRSHLSSSGDLRFEVILEGKQTRRTTLVNWMEWFALIGELKVAAGPEKEHLAKLVGQIDDRKDKAHSLESEAFAKAIETGLPPTATLGSFGLLGATWEGTSFFIASDGQLRTLDGFAHFSPSENVALLQRDPSNRSDIFGWFVDLRTGSITTIPRGSESVRFAGFVEDQLLLVTHQDEPPRTNVLMLDTQGKASVLWSLRELEYWWRYDPTTKMLFGGALENGKASLISFDVGTRQMHSRNLDRTDLYGIQAHFLPNGRLCRWEENGFNTTLFLMETRGLKDEKRFDLPFRLAEVLEATNTLLLVKGPATAAMERREDLFSISLPDGKTSNLTAKADGRTADYFRPMAKLPDGHWLGSVHEQGLFVQGNSTLAQYLPPNADGVPELATAGVGLLAVVRRNATQTTLELYRDKARLWHHAFPFPVRSFACVDDKQLALLSRLHALVPRPA